MLKLSAGSDGRDLVVHWSTSILFLLITGVGVEDIWVGNGGYSIRM